MKRCILPDCMEYRPDWAWQLRNIFSCVEHPFYRWANLSKKYLTGDHSSNACFICDLWPTSPVAPYQWPLKSGYLSLPHQLRHKSLDWQWDLQNPHITYHFPLFWFHLKPRVEAKNRTFVIWWLVQHEYQIRVLSTNSGTPVHQEWFPQRMPWQITWPIPDKMPNYDLISHFVGMLFLVSIPLSCSPCFGSLPLCCF